MNKLLTAIALVALTSCQPVQAHQAPSGWEYPTTCCNGKDCHPTPVEEVGGGYYIPETKETIPYGDSRVKPSGDGESHRCGSEMHTRCIFIPLSS